MNPLYLADTTALLELELRAPEDDLNDVLSALADKVARDEFGFPSDVVDDLRVRGRRQRVTSWAVGIRELLKPYNPEYDAILWFSRHAQRNMGYVDGITALDGKDPIVVPVAASAFQVSQTIRPFRLVSHDVGSVPLRPTMSEVCTDLGWEMVTMQDALTGCGIQLPA